ncbi:glycosyltransferase family 2 protein [uncultured Desulfosarcina sp.]|uniref:glycosyltransferase family 2 protein n=1 Tax=uncultured Desulfosarcina sp. TaxID=218289 RepID=UPI0029C79EF2|nr:glycosyltransferase family 2 protein [uncultured Desulfosarcina sp.]
MGLAVIIVNYRTPKLVRDCLESIMDEIEDLQGVAVVVDNNSGDGSAEYLSETIKKNRWEKRATLLPQERNLGFAAGNNAAIRHLSAIGKLPDHLMLLNPDTVVQEGAINKLVRFLNKKPKVGIVGAQLENNNRVPESSARRFPSVWSELESGARLGVLSQLLTNYRVALPIMGWPFRCDWVSGAAMVVRRQVFERIGLMDEGFFLYFEELDFCHRAHNAGWQIWLEPVSRIVHLEGQATGIQKKRSRRGKYWYDSRRRYWMKHHGLLILILADLLWGIGRLSLLMRVKLGLGGDVSCDPLHFFRDLIVGDVRALMNGTGRTI